MAFLGNFEAKNCFFTHFMSFLAFFSDFLPKAAE